jgi:hypothetical protein
MLDLTLSSDDKTRKTESATNNGTEMTTVGFDNSDKSTAAEVTPIEERTQEQRDNDTSPEEGQDQNHLSGLRLISVVASLMLAVFCVALDNTSQEYVPPQN